MTLILVIVLIASWSIYALYKFSVGGSDSILGFTFNKANPSPIQAVKNGDYMASSSTQRTGRPGEQADYRRNMIEDFLAGQRELHDYFEGPQVKRDEQDRSGITNSVKSIQRKTAPITGEPNQDHLEELRTIHRVPLQTFSNLAKVKSSSSINEPDEDFNEIAEKDSQLDQSETSDVDQNMADRQPAESSNEASESIAESPDEAETSTPSSVANEQVGDDQEGVEDTEESGQEEPDQKQNTEESPNEGIDDDQVEAARDKGKAIDQEVDRMTEPSLGVVSRHTGKGSTQTDYNKNVVQFDDTLSTIPASSTSKKDAPTRHANPSGQVARFADPVANKSEPKPKKLLGLDLQVDQNNQPVSLSDAQHLPDSNTTSRSRGHRKGIDELTAMKRHKRTVDAPSANRIESQKDLDNYFDTLDLDNLIENTNYDLQATATHDDINLVNATRTTTEKERFPKRADSTLDGARSINPSQPVNSTLRRSDTEDYEGGDGEEGEEDGQDVSRATIDDLHSELNRLNKQQPDGGPSKYHYISTNDTSLKELLNHQRLLDDLRHSQLPRPYTPGTELNQSHINPHIAPSTNSVPDQSDADHQTAGSLYTVDHGLLLYPSADEEHHHKHKSSSMSKKKKKHEKMKAKKKSTVAMKKGGHKKKKHKKEEKKYLKEKKFKGAKKGKKVAKGKGGQGGKKGKKLYKDKGFKKKGFKNVYHKEEFGQKKSYFDEFRDKDFKKKWKKYDDKYNYAQMKKWQAKDVKGAKKMKDSGERFKKYDKSKWKKKYEKHSKEHKLSSKKKKKKKVSSDF